MQRTATLLKHSVGSAVSGCFVLERGRSLVESFRGEQLAYLASCKGTLRLALTRQKLQLVACPLALSLRFHSDASSSHDSQGNGTCKNSNAGAHSNDDEDSVLKKCKWDSSEFSERLGFAPGESFDENRLRQNYRILVKFFHPDSSNAPQQHATEAFQKIKEAYDALSQTFKDNTTGGNFRASAHQGVEGMSFADEARRRAQMRVLGDGIVLFLLMTLLYIYMVSRHNTKRLRSHYLWHFVGIFFIIQIFPRLLAAAILFACHTTYLIANAELKEQSAATILLRQGAHDMRIQLQGIPSQDAANVVVQVVISVPNSIVTTSSAIACGKENTEPPNKDAHAVLHSTTLTFDKGVLDVVVPLPSKGVEQKTTYAVKAVDQNRKFVLVDKNFSLML